MLFQAFIKGHISIIVITINSCSTNLQQIGGWRLKNKGGARKAVIGWPGFVWVRRGIWSFCISKFSWMWMFRLQPKTFLISISISRKNYNENKSHRGRQQTLNIKADPRQELAKGRRREVFLLDLTKDVGKPYSPTCHNSSVPNTLFKELFQILSIIQFLSLCIIRYFIRYLPCIRPWARPHRNIMN